MFYFDKTNPNVTFMDIRRYSDILCDGRKLEVNPDVIGDFRNMQFSNDEFDLVVFDPPHLIKAGKNSWLAKNMDCWILLVGKMIYLVVLMNA